MDAQVVALLKHGLEATRNIIISVLIILMNAADGWIRAAEATAHKRLLFIMVVFESFEIETNPYLQRTT